MLNQTQRRWINNWNMVPPHTMFQTQLYGPQPAAVVLYAMQWNTNPDDWPAIKEEMATIRDQEQQQAYLAIVAEYLGTE